MKYDIEIQDVKKLYHLSQLLQKFSEGKGNDIELLNSIKKIAPQVFENMQIIAKENENSKSDFSSEFKEKYNKILEFAKEHKLLLYAHGTASDKIANLISKTGLRYKQPELGATALAMGIFEEEDYKKMLNWPHRKHTNFVLLGIPRETVKYWKEDKQSDDEWDTYDAKYVIPPEFILGTIDAITETIEMNPTFSLEHDTDDLIQDMAKKHIGKVESSDEFVQTIVEKSKITMEFCVNHLLITCNDLIKSLKSGYSEIHENGTGIIHGHRDEPFQIIIEGCMSDYQLFMQSLMEFEQGDGIEMRDSKENKQFDGILEAISQRATISGINQETQHIKSKTRDRSEHDIGIARDEEWD